MPSKNTEILATVGPATINILEQLYANGMNGIRINSSHGTREFHKSIIEESRRVNPRGYIVYDIKGPKIRLGDIPEPLPVKAGDFLILRTDISKPAGSDYPAVDSFEYGIPVTYNELDKFVKPGHRLFIDDAYVGIEVMEVSPGKILCRVLFGDIIRSRKGLNHPDTIVEYPYTLPNDIADLAFAAENRVDYVADSFTRNRDDVFDLRKQLKGTGILIISKIENPEGLANFDEILDVTDAVMIARGDLGVEIDPVSLPEHQKVMTEKCNMREIPVITATQMLESMIDNPRPSRSDVSDIANAIYDGTDVIMLSGETSIGKYPVECVKMMKRIAENVEKTDRYKNHKKSVNGLTHKYHQ
ncbi:MAG: pyruvate kinase [Prolixibacteraceae bacterium]|nr:pyruvate kinase [Prolixibacteraceae bacterium]